MEYPKIETVFNRDPADMKRVRVGEWRDPAFRLVSHWLLTEKIDGTNIRLHLKDGAVIVSGRTDDTQTPNFLMHALQAAFPAEKVAAAFEPNAQAIIYGEGYGPKIQKGGGCYRDTPGFIVFDVAVLTPTRVWWLDWPAVCDVAGKIGAPTVPVIAEAATVDEAVRLCRASIASKAAATARTAEGVVARTVPGLLMRNGARLVWKLKARDFGAPDNAAPPPPAPGTEAPRGEPTADPIAVIDIHKRADAMECIVLGCSNPRPEDSCLCDWHRRPGVRLAMPATEARP